MDTFEGILAWYLPHWKHIFCTKTHQHCVFLSTHGVKSTFRTFCVVEKYVCQITITNTSAKDSHDYTLVNLMFATERVCLKKGAPNPPSFMIYYYVPCKKNMCFGVPHGQTHSEHTWLVVCLQAHIICVYVYIYIYINILRFPNLK